MLAILWVAGLWYSGHTYSADVWKPESGFVQSHEFVAILTNNMAMVIRNMLSFIFLAVPAILNVFLNGYIFGLYLTKYAGGTGYYNLLVQIAPYAIFELAGLFLSVVVAIELSVHLIRFLLKGAAFSRGKIKGMLFSVALVFILILIGAVVESIKIAKLT